MEWIRENWVFIIFFILFIAMHFFGRGMHGGCGGHDKEDEHKGHGEGESEKKEKKGGHGCC
jgi:hypothetical protein